MTSAGESTAGVSSSTGTAHARQLGRSVQRTRRDGNGRTLLRLGVDLHRRAIASLRARPAVVFLLPQRRDALPRDDHAPVRLVDRGLEHVPVQPVPALLVHERPPDDVRRVHDLVLHELVEHDPDHLVAPPPERRRDREDVRLGLRAREPARPRRDAARGEVAEEEDVALDGVEEVREGARADVQQGLHGDGAHDRVDVHVALARLGDRVPDGLEVGHHVFGLCARAELVEHALSRVVVGGRWGACSEVPCERRGSGHTWVIVIVLRAGRLIWHGQR